MLHAEAFLSSTRIACGFFSMRITEKSETIAFFAKEGYNNKQGRGICLSIERGQLSIKICMDSSLRPSCRKTKLGLLDKPSMAPGCAFFIIISLPGMVGILTKPAFMIDAWRELCLF